MTVSIGNSTAPSAICGITSAINSKYVSLPCTSYLSINGHCLYHYRFTLIDPGVVGCHSYGGLLAHSKFGTGSRGQFPLISCTLSISRYHAAGSTLRHVGDEAFPLRTNMLRLYPRRNPTGVFGNQISQHGGLIVIVLLLHGESCVQLQVEQGSKDY